MICLLPVRDGEESHSHSENKTTACIKFSELSVHMHFKTNQFFLDCIITFLIDLGAL